MSNYQLKLTSRAEKQLAKLDNSIQKQIIKWLMKNLQNTTNPRQHGKGLTGDRVGQWRYRVGNYRILATIKDEIVTIEVFKIEHRSTSYKRKR